MKELIDYILKFGNLTSSQIDLIVSKATKFELHKNEYFSEAGKIPKYVGFVLEGVFRFCYLNKEGEEITHYFIEENSFVTDFPRFEAQIVAAEYVQAVTDCKLLVFSKQDWDEISNRITSWDVISGKIEKSCLITSIESRSHLVSEDATSRYLSFLEKFPTIMTRVPLSYIASYLGITQQSLSRIRKNIH